MRVLIVEADPRIGGALVASLEESGYSADWVPDQAAAEAALRHGSYDLALLDLGFAHHDGVGVLRTLLGRARSVLRAHSAHGRDTASYGALTLDRGRRAARFRNAAVALSAREFAVLEALMRYPGALVTRDRLVESVYGPRAEVESNAIDVHLHHLRRKLCPQLILNVRGVGFRLARVE